MKQDAANELGISIAGSVIGAVVGGGIIAAMSWAAPALIPIIGLPFTCLFCVLIGLTIITFFFAHIYYVGVLGASGKAASSREHVVYERLRRNLSMGGVPARLYAERLAIFLNAVDRFFGDADTPERTLLPNFLWLKSCAPLWTTSAFDRCLLLAIVYPITTIILVWSISGQVGPAEAMLNLPFSLAIWERAFCVFGFSLVGVAVWRSLKSQHWFFAWMSIAVSVAVVTGLFFAVPVAAAAVFSIAIAIAFTGIDAGASVVMFVIGVAFAIAVTFATAIAIEGSVATTFGIEVAGVVLVCVIYSGIFAATRSRIEFIRQARKYLGRLYQPTVIGLGILAIAILVIISYFAFKVAYDLAFAFSLALSFLMAVTSAVVCTALGAGFYQRAVEQERDGLFLCVLLPCLILVCLFAAWILSRLRGWPIAAPMLLFLGLFPLLNAPFDWASLGLTRALLRRGVELGGWSPYLLAFVDAALAVIIVAILSCVVVISIQIFDLLVVLGGGQSTLPLQPLIDGIARAPSAPQYWWAYCLLFSTMLPSVFNLVIGGASLTRGIPGLSSALLRRMPEKEKVLEFDRNWIALVLTTQWLVGAALGVSAQVLLAWIILGEIMPALGLDLLDVVRWVVSQDFPAHIYRLVG